MALKSNHLENSSNKFNKIATRINEPYGIIPEYSHKQAFKQSSYWLSAAGFMGWLTPWSDPRSFIGIDLLWASYLGGNRNAAYELCALFIQTKSDFDEVKATEIIGITNSDVISLLVRLATEGYDLAAKDLDYNFHKELDRNHLFELLMKNREINHSIDEIVQQYYYDLLVDIKAR